MQRTEKKEIQCYILIINRLHKLEENHRIKEVEEVKSNKKEKKRKENWYLSGAWLAGTLGCRWNRSVIWVYYDLRCLKREKVKNQSRGRDIGDVGRALIMSGGKEILVNPIHRNSR